MGDWKGFKINFLVQQHALNIFMTLLCEMSIKMEDLQQQQYVHINVNLDLCNKAKYTTLFK
jgi:hypothetical protein